MPFILFFSPIRPVDYYVTVVCVLTLVTHGRIHNVKGETIKFDLFIRRDNERATTQIN